MSANDGATHGRLNADGRSDTEYFTPDSITAIYLGPDPPLARTVYGTVPNSIISVPYLPMTPDGHYDFVSSAGIGPKGEPANLLSVINLASPDLEVVQKVEVPDPTTGVMHPDGKHLIIPDAKGFGVFELANGKLTLVKDNLMPFRSCCADINARGDRLIAVEIGLNELPASTPLNPTVDISLKTVHVFSYKEGLIEHLGEVKVKPGLPEFKEPFSPRFSPDGLRVLVLNGGGTGTKGKLDALLSIDMTLAPPLVTEAISQVADGMEGVAFHPSGRMAVIGCLEETNASATYSHLAVVDLTSKPMRLLYETNIEPVPEGIEFSPDGTQLFVQSTAAHHISVFEVDGFVLKRSPFVIRVGHGPAAMGVALRLVR